MKSADITLAKRYARAYMALQGEAFASAAGEAAARNRMGELQKVRDELGPYRGMLTRPLVGYENKKDILAKVLPAAQDASPAANFVRLLLKENRFYLLDAALEECGNIYNAHAGLVRAEVLSRHPLSREEHDLLEKKLHAATGKKPLIRASLSESAIGGLRIQISDLLIDATVRGRLEKLKKSILDD